jgi:undecaprenyl-phosphate 4-deoxy-4-formamido-L-arabinose transferase
MKDALMKERVERRFRVMVVDDHAVVRRGLVTLLGEQVDLEVVGEAGNEADAMGMMREAAPDVAVVDWSLKHRDSSGLVAGMLQERPELRVVVLSIHDELTHGELAIESGAHGYVMKREAAERIVEAIREVLAGRYYLGRRALDGLGPQSYERVLGRLVISGDDGGREAGGRQVFGGWSVSVVVPVFNSRGTLGTLCQELISELRDVERLQLVLVDDGSQDDSADVCEALQGRYPGVVEFLGLSRNFGEHNAVMAGLRQATGDWCVIMDDDLQNPPSEVKKLLRHAAMGFDVVYSRYRVRRHPWYRRWGSALHNWTACVALGKPRELYLSSFKVLSKTVRREVTRYEGAQPYLDALILRATRSIGVVDCDHHERPDGRSGYTTMKLLGLWTRMALGFSVWPIRLLTFGGGLVCVVAAVWDLAGGGQVSDFWGWLVRGSTLLLVGLIGEYVGRIYSLMNGAPQYVVARRSVGARVDLESVGGGQRDAHRHEAA